jgi:hypothetical protein
MNYRVFLSVFGAIALAWSSADAQQSTARWDGVWSSTLTTPNDSRWRIEDHLCGVCTPSEYQHLQRLLADPANNARSLQELQQETRVASRQEIEQTVTVAGRERASQIAQPADESELCNPPNLLVVAAGPLPISIEVHADHVILRNQHWNVVRTVPVSDRAPLVTNEPSLYGDSTARVEGATLVVESVNVLPMTLAEAVTTEKATIIERYTASEDGSRLALTVEIRDSDTYREPRLVYRSRIRTPEVRLVDDEPCANLED